MDYRAEARRAAQRYGLDPNIFVRQIGAESGFNPRARSRAGAQGIAQIMPATARAWGVDPNNPRAALNAAARNMANYVRRYGSYENALRAYNAGPGRIAESRRFDETNNYVRKILQGRDPRGLTPRRRESPTRGGPSTAEAGLPPTGDGQSLASMAGEGARLAALLLAQPSEDKPRIQSVGLATPEFAAGPVTPKGAMAVQAGGAQREAPGEALARALSGVRTLEGVDLPAAPESAESGVRTPGTVSANGPPSSGAQAALGWAVSKLGSRETAGENAGGLASYANSRFGMARQPWCAMFTSLAVTKGGAPLSARTASVAQVREKVSRGEGYQRGYIPRSRAKPGDLILFGNRHIAMVESVERDGTLRYVGGNQSDSVTRGKARNGDIVRPLYGRRR